MASELLGQQTRVVLDVEITKAAKFKYLRLEFGIQKWKIWKTHHIY